MTGPSKRREDTDIDQFFLPGLTESGINPRHLRRNEATRRSMPYRGDFWISLLPHTHPDFEEAIIALIECKDRKAKPGDKDWMKGVMDGQKKARLQGLKSFFVTNTETHTRCYSVFDRQEISVDGEVLATIPTIAILRTLQAQVSPVRVNVLYSTFASRVPNANRFRSSLWNIRQIFRSKGISRGEEDKIIKSTLTFCILKLMTERQKLFNLLPKSIMLWSDWRPSQMHRDIKNSIADIVVLPKFRHLTDCLWIDKRLDAEACVLIHEQIGQFDLFGSDFDFFGLVYETLANKNLKKDFGEFYTPRHIIRFIVRTLLRDEKLPRPLRICDPACGTGGFLVEAYLYLQNQYKDSGAFNDTVLANLKNSTFVGFDNNDRYSIPYARTNMLMAGDGGSHIKWTEDSLTSLSENLYDYIVANIPYGAYAGTADVQLFEFGRQRRYEYLFLEKIVKALKPGGQAAVIVPDGLVENSSLKGYRQSFMASVDVHAVVSLPAFSFLPYTHEKTYILYFSRKQVSKRGVPQSDPIWHCIIDNDGFQDGNKRYPIAEDDLGAIGNAEFMNKEEPNRCGLVDIEKHFEQEFVALSSETYLRRQHPVELELSDFEQTLKAILGSVRELASELGGGKS
jgi:type I restriction enzyme M protein